MMSANSTVSPSEASTSAPEGKIVNVGIASCPQSILMGWSCHRTKGKDKARSGLQRRVREQAAAFRAFSMLASADGAEAHW